MHTLAYTLFSILAGALSAAIMAIVAGLAILDILSM